jgi:hypothetical protein
MNPELRHQPPANEGADNSDNRCDPPFDLCFRMVPGHAVKAFF